jgi:hypothetical protein
MSRLEISLASRAIVPLLNARKVNIELQCKPRASCMVTWIIYQPISPLLHVHKLRSQTSRLLEHNTQYTSQHHISIVFLLTVMSPA